MSHQKDRKLKLQHVEQAPDGLSAANLLADGDAEPADVERALAQFQAILESELASQIAQNQHFFINLPFPLASLTREAATPTYDLSDSRVAAIVRLVERTLDKFGVAGAEQATMLASANIIAREYRPGQQISFHIDELQCSAVVFGLILLNDDEAHRGLNFRRGRGREHQQQCYVLSEHPGTVFEMRDGARYEWRHGLPPVAARRISVTMRFFKADVLAEWRQTSGANGALLSERSFLHEPAPASGRVSVTLKANGNHAKMAVVVVATPVEHVGAIETMARNKLRLRKKRPLSIYRVGGALLHDGASLASGDVLFVSEGEPYSGPAAPAAAPSAATPLPRATLLGDACIAKMVGDWDAFSYARLRFWTTVCARSDAPETLQVCHGDRFACAALVEACPLSTPELRTLFQVLGPAVDARDDLQWLFASHATHADDEPLQRRTTVAIGDATQLVAFSVGGAATVKGAKKRDGELWRLRADDNSSDDTNDDDAQ